MLYPLSYGGNRLLILRKILDQVLYCTPADIFSAHLHFGLKKTKIFMPDAQ